MYDQHGHGREINRILGDHKRFQPELSLNYRNAVISNILFETRRSQRIMGNWCIDARLLTLTAENSIRLREENTFVDPLGIGWSSADHRFRRTWRKNVFFRNFMFRINATEVSSSST